MAVFNGTDSDDVLVDTSSDLSSTLNANWSGGEDHLTGGSGDDTYHINSAGDQVVEQGGQGEDRVASRLASYTLPDHVEDLQLDSTPTELVTLPDGSTEMRPAAREGCGNGLDNTLRGNFNDNTLTGLDGNDELWGGDGNDTLRGGNGNDLLMGGADGDLYGENDTLMGDAGNDLLYGRMGEDRLYGGDGNDRLDGGGGADRLEGGRGQDVYYSDPEDTIIETRSGGVDTVHSQGGYTLGKHLENLTLTVEAGDADGRGNSLANVISGNGSKNTLWGMNGNDTLLGDDGDDVLHGGAGNDILVGQSGRDSLTGGAGADRFVFGIPDGFEHDTLTDFLHADDSILLPDLMDSRLDAALAPGIRGLVFDGGNVAGAVLKAHCFFSGEGHDGSNAADRSGIYVNTLDGQVWYNPTAGIGGDALLLGSVSVAAAATLDSSDFLYGA
ncbi:hypothetical protein OOT46_20515 [Aquabacterium sp. A7-Y]|uniref:calcium-binding protein n=1 Tax=Aquabacterium sp. A7-Y TaxID=1349605 RepID=UPI00223E460A|nr:calcium-binding protein [Aquabacterium sp. A7-Y]MCW7540221.1 hypothetical protein [Aquabacterium sp. A7-Y]